MKTRKRLLIVFHSRTPTQWTAIAARGRMRILSRISRSPCSSRDRTLRKKSTALSLTSTCMTLSVTVSLGTIVESSSSGALSTSAEGRQV
jgi:hypothetical protein